MHDIHYITLLLSSVLVATGCGSDAVAPPRSDEAREDAAEFARIQQRLGEPTCGATAADAILDLDTDDPYPGAHTENGSYDHPDCRNGFVVDVPGAKAGALPRG